MSRASTLKVLCDSLTVSKEVGRRSRGEENKDVNSDAPYPAQRFSLEQPVGCRLGYWSLRVPSPNRLLPTARVIWLNK